MYRLPGHASDAGPRERERPDGRDWRTVRDREESRLPRLRRLALERAEQDAIDDLIGLDPREGWR
jgi:hypothetical protein